MSEERIETETRWLVKDTADGLYLRHGAPRGARIRAPVSFVKADYATFFKSAEEAARGVLAVDSARFPTLVFVEQRVERKAGLKASDTVPPPRKFGVVPSSWLAATGSFSAEDLLDTVRIVESRDVDPQDLEAVAEIFAEVTGQQSRMKR